MTTAHPLQQRIALLRRSVRWLVAVHGLGMVAAAVLATIIVLAGADYLIRFQDRGMRVICSLAVLGAAGWSAYRYLYLPWLAPLRDAELAQRLQQRFPLLDDRLVSAVEFLAQPQDDPRLGSAALRRAVIAQAGAESGPLDFADALDRRLPRRAALLAAGAALLAAGLLTLDPPAARLALRRLLDPLGNRAWPQITHLELRRPVECVARGRPFEIEVVDARGARLPAEVRIHYRFLDAGGAPSEEVQPMQFLGGAMVARRENVSRPFEFRAEGGDDRSMLWRPVEVLEPPAVRSLTIAVIPPAYSGWPAAKLGAGASLRALVGSRLRIAGESSQPLRSAAICVEGGRERPAAIGPDRLHFTLGDGAAASSQRSAVSSQAPTANPQSPIPNPQSPLPPAAGLLVERSSAYWLKLIDTNGLEGGSESRWELHAVPDDPPSVVIERPAGTVFVTPRAVVPLRAVARSNMALDSLSLVFAPADRPAQQSSLVISRGAPEPPPADKTAGGEQLQRRAVDYRWDLEGLRLAPGTQVLFHAEASDYRPAWGKSEPRRLSVITTEDLQDRLAARQNVLLAELLRLLGLQRNSRQEVGALEISARQAGSLTQLEVDHLQAAELNQRHVSRSLASRTDGVPMHVLSLLSDLENNRVDQPDFERRLRLLLAHCEQLEREHLPPLGRELTAAVKAAQVRLADRAAPAAARAALADALARAAGRQDQVVIALEAMLGQLHEGSDYRRYHRDLAQLLHDQEQLTIRAAEVGRLTLAKDLKDLSPQESAELQILADSQLELARRLDRLEQEMGQAAGQLQAADPLASETLAEALAEARRLALAAAMRSAAADLAENRTGKAAASHKQITAGLQAVLDLLANRRQQELGRLVRDLRQAEADLAALCKQQEGLAARLDRAAAQPQPARQRADLVPLAREQDALCPAARQLALRLDRLLAEEAGQTVGRAAGQMQHSCAAAAAGDGPRAVAQAKEALKSLEQAARLLADRRFQAQAGLVMEQLARLEEALKDTARRQQDLLERTRQIDALRQPPEPPPPLAASQPLPLTRQQAAKLGELARLQHVIQTETAQLAEPLTADAFRQALRAVRDEMGRAAEELDRRQSGPPAQQAQHRALDRLALLLAALEPEKIESTPESSGGGNANAGKPEGQPTGVRPLAELRLLKLLQQDLATRTKQLHKAAPGGPSGQAPSDAYAALGQEQGRLADSIGDGRGTAADARQDPILEVGRQMRQAQGLLQKHNAGLETQVLQRQIVSDLQKIIDEARKSARGGSAGKQPGVAAQGPKGTGSAEKPAPGSTGPDQGPAKESNPNAIHKPDQHGPEREQQAQRLMHGLWGSLPPGVSQQLLQLPPEEFLPQYEVQIEDYFRRLSEEKASREHQR